MIERTAVLRCALLMLALIACPARKEVPVSPSPRELPAAAEAELAAIRADPIDAIGFGEKSYLPYEIRHGEYLAHSDDAAVIAALEALTRDRTNPLAFRLALVHLVAAHPGSDRALLDMLGDPQLRPLAAHMLGRSGFKGAPPLTVDAARVLDALRGYLDDTTPYVDPWYRRTFLAGDFALAAFIRIAGPDKFALGDPQLASFVGYDLPQFDDATRTALIAQCRALR